jgi:uncharacterized protein (DUF2237 family)
MVSWNGPSERVSDFFSAVARIESSDFTRQFAKNFPLQEPCGRFCLVMAEMIAAIEQGLSPRVKD